MTFAAPSSVKCFGECAFQYTNIVELDIPDGVIAVGNPCKVLRKITKADKDYWTEQAEEYYADADIR